MSLFFESIACQNGRLQNMVGHEKRLNSTRKELLNSSDTIKLDSIPIPEFAKEGLWKCRVSYKYEISKIEFTIHSHSQAQTFRLVKSEMEYPFKYENRSEILKLFKQRGSCDDIIIVNNKMITDSSIGNLIFYDGKKWVTPSSPLLKGTMRTKLLEGGKIQSRSIQIEDLSGFESLMMINALNPFDQSRALPIENIKY